MHSIPTIEDTIRNFHLQPNKKLGQHFLTDPFLLEEIVRMAAVEPGTHVVEIGPGPGGLTRALLGYDAIADVTACELDQRAIAALAPLKAAYPDRFHLMHGDAMEQRLEALCPAPRAVIANLPYNVGTPLVMRWIQELAASEANAFESVTVMLQQEVVSRIVAAPSTPHYGRLSILSQWYCEVEHVMDVPPEAFMPPPKVMSSIVRLTPRKVPIAELSFTALERFVSIAFLHRRKMLRKTLLPWRADAGSLMEACGIDPSRRAETLGLEEIAALMANSD